MGVADFYENQNCTGNPYLSMNEGSKASYGASTRYYDRAKCVKTRRGYKVTFYNNTGGTGIDRCMNLDKATGSNRITAQEPGSPFALGNNDPNSTWTASRDPNFNEECTVVEKDKPMYCQLNDNAITDDDCYLNIIKGSSKEEMTNYQEWQKRAIETACQRNPFSPRCTQYISLTKDDQGSLTSVRRNLCRTNFNENISNCMTFFKNDKTNTAANIEVINEVCGPSFLESVDMKPNNRCKEFCSDTGDFDKNWCNSKRLEYCTLKNPDGSPKNLFTHFCHTFCTTNKGVCDNFLLDVCESVEILNRGTGYSDGEVIATKPGDRRNSFKLKIFTRNGEIIRAYAPIPRKSLGTSPVEFGTTYNVIQTNGGTKATVTPTKAFFMDDKIEGMNGKRYSDFCACFQPEEFYTGIYEDTAQIFKSYLGQSIEGALKGAAQHPKCFYSKCATSTLQPIEYGNIDCPDCVQLASFVIEEGSSATLGSQSTKQSCDKFANDSSKESSKEPEIDEEELKKAEELLKAPVMELNAKELEAAAPASEDSSGLTLEQKIGISVGVVGSVLLLIISILMYNYYNTSIAATIIV